MKAQNNISNSVEYLPIKKVSDKCHKLNEIKCSSYIHFWGKMKNFYKSDLFSFTDL